MRIHHTGPASVLSPFKRRPRLGPALAQFFKKEEGRALCKPSSHNALFSLESKELTNGKLPAADLLRIDPVSASLNQSPEENSAEIPGAWSKPDPTQPKRKL